MAGGVLEDPGGGRRPPVTWRRLVPFALWILAAAIAFALGLHDMLSMEALQEHHRALRAAVEAQPRLVASGYVLAYVVAAAIALPAAVFLAILGGYLFGVWFGGGLAVSAATIGAIAVFVVAGTSLGRYLRATRSPLVHRLRGGFQADAWSYLFVLRLLPLLPFSVVNVLPAVLGVRLHVFAVTTFFGMLPGAFIYAGIGHGLRGIIVPGEPIEIATILDPAILVPLGGLALLALLPMVLRRLRVARGLQRAVP